MATKKILFTGGGSAGHVTPNIALIQHFLQAGWEVEYIGSRRGIEKTILQDLPIVYHPITTGKLRRQIHWRTLLTPFQVVLGIIQAWFVCYRRRPTVLFSKGGYVAFPAVFAAWLYRIPVFCHESDLTPGLANRISFPFVKKIFVTFSETQRYLPAKKPVVVSGAPIRKTLLQGDKARGLALCGFTDKKPVLLVLGGGLGAKRINTTLGNILETLLQTFQVIHLCGKGKMDPTYQHLPGYKPFEYVHDTLGDLFACADLVVSRAGSNALYELLALRKPHILIPLSKKASRGDQIVNADYFAKQGLSVVIREKNLTEEKLLETIQHVYQNKAALQQKLATFSQPDSVQVIASVISNTI